MAQLVKDRVWLDGTNCYNVVKDGVKVGELWRTYVGRVRQYPGHKHLWDFDPYAKGYNVQMWTSFNLAKAEIERW